MKQRKFGKWAVLWLLCMIMVLGIVNLPGLTLRAKASGNEAIKELHFTIVLPEAGVTPTHSYTSTDAGTYVASYGMWGWRERKSNGGWGYPDYIFHEKTYSYIISMSPKAGYEFTDETKVYMNGNLISQDPRFTRDGYVAYCYDYKVPGSTKMVNIVFNANGGTGTMSTVTQLEGKEWTFPECGFRMNNGKVFYNWEVDGTTYYPGDKIIVTKDITVKAVWGDPLFYTLSFDLGGYGNAGDYPSQTNIPINGTATAVENPTDPNAVFAGWFTDAAFHKPFDFSDKLNADITLYAKWKVRLSGAKITGVILPVAGETPGTVAVKNDTLPYTLDDVRYAEFDTYGAMDVKTTPFVAGETAVFVVGFRTNNSYFFDEKSKVTINGTPAKYFSNYSRDGYYRFYVEYEVKVPLPQIVTQPANKTVNDGATATFTVTVSNAESYQWQVSTDGGNTWNDSTAVNAKTASLSFTARASYSGRKYRCVAKNSAGSVTSKVVALTVNPSKPVITTQPVAANVAAGETVNYKVVATGATAYQWQFSADNGSTWNNCTGTGYNTANLSFTMLAKYTGRLYRCKVSNAGGSVNSNAVALTVKVVGKPVITAQPVAVKAAVGETVAYSVTATSATAYQWQFSADNGSTWSNCSGTGYNTANLSFKMAAKYAGRLYRCKVSNAEGSVNSAAVALTLKTAGKPVITTQPVAINAAVGEAVNYKVVATGATAYQWQFSADNGSTWSNCSGTGYNTANLSFTMAAKYAGRLYRCKVSNAEGSVNSNAVALTVKVVGKPVITAQPVAVNAAVGEKVTYKITAAGATAYQWQYSTNGGSTWSNCSGTGYNTESLSFNMMAKYAGRLYRCKVSNASGTVNSSAVALTLK